MMVDVIIPVYNGRRRLQRAVDSALECASARVLLVDDGSTDGSSALCDQLAENPRVRVIHRENGGASAARNTGLHASDAAFVTFLDADDVLLPGALALLLDCFGENPAADAVQGCVTRRPERAAEGSVPIVVPGISALQLALSDPTRHLHCHGWVFRRSALTEAFNEALTLGEDGEWLLRTLRHAGDVAFADVPAYCYTVRRDSALHSASNVPQRYLQTLEAASPALAALDMPQAAALYRLTHLLLMLTHGVFRQKGLLNAWREAAALCRQEPFAGAFRTADLSGHAPRILALRLLRRGWIPLAWGVIRARQLYNDFAAARSAADD